jgi:CheY-like chemotaxis protein
VISTAKETQILVVDDNDGDVFFIWETLKDSSLRCSLSVATDGVEAMNFLRRRGKFAAAPRPDLVLMDVNMPRMNGFEVLKEMKQDADLRSIPVIILSGSNADEDVRRAYDLHASCYVNKPSDLDGMVAVVQGIATFWIKFATLPPGAGLRIPD